jgi:hypothetical protein
VRGARTSAADSEDGVTYQRYPAGILLCIGFASSVGCHWIAPRERDLDRIAVGATEADVKAALGAPDLVVVPRPSHWCDSTPVAEEHARPGDRACVRQWIYKIGPAVCDSVCFGTSGKVISTYHYVSP